MKRFKILRQLTTQEIFFVLQYPEPNSGPRKIRLHDIDQEVTLITLTGPGSIRREIFRLHRQDPGWTGQTRCSLQVNQSIRSIQQLHRVFPCTSSARKNYGMGNRNYTTEACLKLQNVQSRPCEGVKVLCISITF